MATTTIKATYSLDPETVRLLERVSRRWGVSKSEARRAHAALAWTEFLCGPVSVNAIDMAAQLLGEPVSFGAADATLAARLFNETGRRRGSLLDCMIAATAIEGDAALATSNRADFRRLESLGLRLSGIEA